MRLMAPNDGDGSLQNDNPNKTPAGSMLNEHLFEGTFIISENILLIARLRRMTGQGEGMRQRGTTWHCGVNSPCQTSFDL
mmetsp:Transcript_57328/g.68514  ORF Transcript_57328/g.68514 Transcript_57328/m.68514 type:complete len:80 (+) Transcript_57328:2061-2300(+)